MNKEKSQELALLPLQLRQDHLAPAFDCIIRKLDDDVKEGSENIMKNKHESLATESIGNWYDIPPDDRVITYPPRSFRQVGSGLYMEMEAAL